MIRNLARRFRPCSHSTQCAHCSANATTMYGGLPVCGGCAARLGRLDDEPVRRR